MATSQGTGLETKLKIDNVVINYNAPSDRMLTWQRRESSLVPGDDLTISNVLE